MRAYNAAEAELLQEIRQLALDMLRFEVWKRQAAERFEYMVVAELDAQRDLARERRSDLMREIWNARHPSRQVVAVV
jgi:hypothetical protein